MFKNLLAISIVMLVSGCSSINYKDVSPGKGFASQSSALIAASEKVGANKNSSVLLRIFKQSNELELWRKTSTGYQLVNTFSICAYSGVLGPKRIEGDYQAPEGFYSINSSQMNYQSIRFLSINTGFPNAYDREHRATGASLMIHGGCDSAGCYAIEDAPMQDLFAAVRDALKAGQKSVQLQIYPFRMNSINMILNNNEAHNDFWHQLKIGYDRFELTKQELNVSVVNKRYVIN